MRRFAFFLAGLLLFSTPLPAQTLGPLDGQYAFPFLYGGTPPPGVTPAAPGAALDPANDYIGVTRYSPSNIGTFVSGSSISVQELLSAVPQTVGVTSGQLVALSNRLDRMRSRFDEGIALAGSFNVLPPNPGDRFAISFGGSGYDATGAGSVAVSARLTESSLVYFGYARGPSQNFVKGGVGFSIH